MKPDKPTSEEVKEWLDWVQARPASVREVAEKVFPWKLYRLKPSGHIVTLYSIDEPLDGSTPTLKVQVLNQFNPNLAFERTVFGIRLEDLEEIQSENRV